MASLGRGFGIAVEGPSERSIATRLTIGSGVLVAFAMGWLFSAYPKGQLVLYSVTAFAVSRGSVQGFRSQ